MNSLLNNLSLGTKIIGNASILLALFIISSVYTIYAMNGIERELSTVAKRDIPLTEHVTAIATNQLRQTLEFERAYRFGLDMKTNDKARDQFNSAIATFDKESDLINQQLQKAMDVINGLHSSNGQTQQEFSSVARALEQIDTAHTEFADHAHSVFSALSTMRSTDVDRLVQQLEQEADDLDRVLTVLLDDIATFTDAAANTALEHEQDALLVIIAMVSVSTLFGMLVSWYIARSIVRGVKRAIVTASGDLTQEIHVDSNDEIGELLHAMNGLRQKLLDMISQISGTTAQLATASEEMSVITEQTSRTIDEQRSETEQVATAMNEMSATAQEIAESVNQTATAVADAREHSSQGSLTVQRTIDQIQKLAQEVDLSAKAISEVEEYSNTISTVLEVIKAIAEQTNLLALNAAIEAARAGEQGRGFAVVADEVRALASRTQHSTNEINDMISKLQTVSHKAVESMMSNKTQVDATVNMASEAGTALNTIDQAMAKVNDMAIQIAGASEEQVGVAEEINTNLLRINGMTNQTAEGAEETSAASRDLTRMASDLQTLVGQFQV